MTAAVDAPPAASKAGQFADKAEDLGWSVKREVLPEGGRLVTAVRGGEEYQLAWHRNSRGLLVYTYGDYYAPNSNEAIDVTNVQAALRDMAKVRSANGSLLPFDIEDDDDRTILAACAGKHIEWRSELSGLIEEAEVSRGGVHYKITQGSKGDNGGARVLHFSDPIHTGFRSVYLDAITKVS